MRRTSADNTDPAFSKYECHLEKAFIQCGTNQTQSLLRHYRTLLNSQRKRQARPKNRLYFLSRNPMFSRVLALVSLVPFKLEMGSL
jgi:hypothetical protein